MQPMLPSELLLVSAHLRHDGLALLCGELGVLRPTTAAAWFFDIHNWLFVGLQVNARSSGKVRQKLVHARRILVCRVMRCALNMLHTFTTDISGTEINPVSFALA